MRLLRALHAGGVAAMAAWRSSNRLHGASASATRSPFIAALAEGLIRQMPDGSEFDRLVAAQTTYEGAQSVRDLFERRLQPHLASVPSGTYDLILKCSQETALFGLVVGQASIHAQQDRAWQDAIAGALAAGLNLDTQH